MRGLTYLGNAIRMVLLTRGYFGVAVLLNLVPGCGTTPPTTAVTPTPAFGLPIPLASPSGPCLTVQAPCAWSASEQVLMVVHEVHRGRVGNAPKTRVSLRIEVTNESNPGRSFAVTTLSFVLVDGTNHRYDVARLGGGCTEPGIVVVGPAASVSQRACYTVPSSAAGRLILIWSPGAGISDLDYNDFAVRI